MTDSQLGLDLDELLQLVPDGGATRPRGSRRAAPARPGQGAPGEQALLPLGVSAVSAVEIARALGRPDPTSEQVAVIEADPAAPLLVVAGAGSGKTETMAARVVWLVANGHVASEEILGLTFTRKAAGELADRVRSRLRALYRRGLVDVEPQPVTVSTYHAYAAAVLSDHGLRVGIEPGSKLLGEAGAWQLASEVVERWDGDMSGVENVAATVTEAVLALAGECAEHLVAPADVEAYLEGVLDRVATLPAELGSAGPGTPKGPVRERLAKLVAKQRVVPLVAAYAQRKRDLEVLDFGDQVALAARVALEVPEVAAGERERFRVVLLDEYQDTSHGQLVLLRALFGDGHPVTAVGDPHQSIYGWRGASAGNLQRFPADFARVGGELSGTRVLSTSWRNDAAVLAVANRVAADLRTPPRWLHRGGRRGEHVDVPPLVGRPQAGPGRVALGWFATLEDEARAVAEVVAEQWRDPAGRPSAAVLCRARAQFPLVEAALRAQGLPVEVVGLGGLLTVPEVADVRAALEVLHDPTRGDSLMRLLTGAAVRLGPRDVEALGVWAAELTRRRRRATDARTGGSSDARADDVPPVEVVADVVDERSVVEALDELPPAGWHGPAGQELSEPGRRRLDRLGGTLRDLRSRTALPLADLVLDVERALLLDVEVAARPGVRPGAARAHLDAFADVAAAFADTGGAPGAGGGARAGSGGSLGAFLGWLAAADTRERGLEAPVTEVRDDAVQVLTVHASKGLEWDVVAVTGLVEGTFPSGTNGRPPGPANGWLGDIGALPYPLRGDRAGLPHWAVEGASTQVDLASALDDFREACGEHDVAEERRLAYVAVTRARRLLLMTGAQWGDGSRPRAPSRFLVETADLVGVVGVELLHWADVAEDGTANPRDALVARADWPFDPLGPRRAAVDDGAGRVLAALAERHAAPPVAPAGDRVGWAREVDLLLTERDASTRRDLAVALPRHLSASKVVALATDPLAFAARLRRPMPEPPNPHARRGSAFHAWLEERYGMAALVDVDDLPGAADESAGDEDLAALQAAFLASEWADRVPDAVEVSIETPVAGVVLRGRVDAVFRLPGDAGGDRWEVVDWKTGPPPGRDDDAGARTRAVQLAVYRLAWARLQGVPVEQVGAAFFYASAGRTVRPVDLLDAAGLERLVVAATDGTEPVTA